MTMENLIRQSDRLAELLGLTYQPIAFMFSETKPAGALGFKKAGGGCVGPLIFSASKGKTVAFDENSTGYPCSAFYLGYGEWIFPGIEYFLSHGPVPGRECERFVKTPELARQYVASFKSARRREGAIVFKPVRAFTAGEEPVAVSLFADSDRMSALVFLAHYAHPLSRDRIETGFASACMSLFTIPLRYADEGVMKAFWGLHDIAVRSSLPKEITSLSMPLAMYRELCAHAEEGLLSTGNWEKLRARARGE